MTAFHDAILKGLIDAHREIYDIHLRRAYSQSELTGLFATNLRRFPVVTHISERRLWDDVLVPVRWGWPKTLTFDGESLTIDRETLVSLCRKAQTMTDDELELTRQLSTLSGKIPTFDLSTIELGRLVRQLEAVGAEAHTFLIQQQEAQ